MRLMEVSVARRGSPLAKRCWTATISLHSNRSLAGQAISNGARLTRRFILALTKAVPPKFSRDRCDFGPPQAWCPALSVRSHQASNGDAKPFRLGRGQTLHGGNSCYLLLALAPESGWRLWSVEDGVGRPSRLSARW